MFGHTAEIKKILEESGFSFVKSDEFPEWFMLDNETIVGRSRSLGDLIRNQALELGVW